MAGEHIAPIKQAVTGGVIAAGGGVPLWLQVVEGITSAAGMIAAVCGAIIGLCGVWRLIRTWQHGKKSD